MPRALKNLDVSLGLATIPVRLFTATSSQGIAFHLLHARCGSRIQMRLEGPNRWSRRVITRFGLSPDQS